MEDNNLKTKTNNKTSKKKNSKKINYKIIILIALVVVVVYLAIIIYNLVKQPTNIVMVENGELSLEEETFRLYY